MQTMTSPRNTVLLCDDDRLVLATVSSGLRAAGFEVVEADNGDDAILLARQHRPQLAVLDMRMDGKSGLDVASYLRDYVGTPFIFLSAFGDDEIVRQARDFGALDYLVKPMDSRRIVEAVQAVLRRISASAAAAGQGAPAADAQAAPSSDAPEIAIATGILMERYRQTRKAAEARLGELAAQSSRSVEQVARELVLTLDQVSGARVTDPVPRA
jgi:response regulator NasT